MSRLTDGQRTVLDALREVPGGGPALPEQVQAQAARSRGYWRARRTVVLTLDALVALGWAGRIVIRGLDGTEHAYYYPASRVGEAREDGDCYA